MDKHEHCTTTGAAIRPKVETWPEWQHRAAMSEETEAGDWLTVDAGLHFIHGNSRPHFSITGELRRGHRLGRMDMCGQLHDQILEQWPCLGLLVSVHLSDDDGAPMYAEANGLYHLGFGRFSKLNYRFVAEHFRITEAQAVALRTYIAVKERPAFERTSADECKQYREAYDRDKYLEVVEHYRPRWKREADAAINVLEGIISGSWSACRGVDHECV